MPDVQWRPIVVVNITIVRRTVWLVAAIALGYTAFAFLEWRPRELIITAGIFLITIPVDLMLGYTAAERRLPPHGPVRKWGYREAGERR